MLGQFCYLLLGGQTDRPLDWRAPGGRDVYLHLDPNSSNLGTGRLQFLNELRGELTQFGRNGAVIGSERQNVLFKSDDPAGLRQGGRSGLLVAPLERGKHLCPARKLGQFPTGGEKSVQTLGHGAVSEV